ncbi:PREDICTED: E3 ubiquitin-protein ligase RNF103-like [Branchiostoma belcheri]|uniref:E3 ubiquitin-protein ligase RNF103-like n=1 Tax=Branchiostoma belcheri TaxID=7741 RepID=A0A6P4YQ41_BRABE|nr:PREDICTED: E3 ubiquitin-protein ligase RNF103-like [Branchiostoma belcheri]
MLVRLLLLLVYLCLLLVAVRLLEAVTWFEAGFLAGQVLDPLSISVRRLKMILDSRGVSYKGVLEKRELTDLVENSGEPKEGEVLLAAEEEDTEPTSTNFTGGAHFYEEVEDTKDSVWLVQVIPEDHIPLLGPRQWKSLVRKVSRFGIRTGTFKCQLDRKLCWRKGWDRPSLALALPRGHQAKGHISVRVFNTPSKEQTILDWINQHLSSRTHSVLSPHQLQTDWLMKNQTHPVQVVFFSRLKQPPMFYSALSVKFTGRVKFGYMRLNESRNSLDISGIEKIPGILVITPERRYWYGTGKGELLNLQSMQTYLRTMQPEVNDVFLLCLVLVNLMAVLEVFLCGGQVGRGVLRLLWAVGKYNCVLLMVCLPVVGLFQLPCMQGVVQAGLTALRNISSSALVAQARQDWLLYSSHKPFLVGTFLLYSMAAGIVASRWKSEEEMTTETTPTEQAGTNGWWSSFMNYLFQPISTFNHTRPPNLIGLEDGLDYLIERLAVPDLWLHPVIPTDYVRNLPVWLYKGKTPLVTKVCSKCCGWGSSADQAAMVMKLPTTAGHSDSSNRVMNLPPSPGRPGHRSPSSTRQSSQPHKCNKTPSACDTPLDHTDNLGSDLAKCTCGERSKAAPTGQGHVYSNHNMNVPSKHANNPSSHDTPPVLPANLDKPCTCGNPQQTPSASGFPLGILHCEDCAICLEEYEVGCSLLGLPCGHSFHERCIMMWLSAGNHCCPVCRWPAFKFKPALHLHSE